MSSDEEICEDCTGVDCRYRVDCPECSHEQWVDARTPIPCPECGAEFEVHAYGEVILL